MILKPQIIILCRLANGYEVKDLNRFLKYNEKHTFIYEDYVRSNDLKMGLSNGWLRMISYMRNVPRRLHLVPHRKPAPPPVLPAPVSPGSSMTPEQIAMLKQELAAEIRAELKNMLPELAASLAKAVPQPQQVIVQATTAPAPVAKPDEPMFIPTIETENMTANLNVKKGTEKGSEQSIDDISKTLLALKKAKKT